MRARSVLILAVFSVTVSNLAAQTVPPTTPAAVPGVAWRPASVDAGQAAVLPATASPSGVVPASGITTATAPTFTAPTVPAAPGGNPFLASTTAPGRRPLRVTAGNGTLPNEQGQVWREYDISPYTARVTTTKRPEQAIVDWILRETGYEVWHSEPLGILSATPRTLRVYHTPQMQAVVAEIVDRFVASEAETRTFSLRIVTIDSPDWRIAAHRTLRPIPAQTAGVSAWLLPKEDAAVLLASLQKRGDYREHSSPHLLVNNGQATVITALRGHPYVRDVQPRNDAWQGIDNQPGQIDEGFSMEFNPLVSADRRTIDAVFKCDINQVEKLVSVMLEVPTQTSPRQRARIEVPQVSHFRFSERFRWPVDQVLMLGMGMVALPVPVSSTTSIAGIPLPLPSSAPRADLLVIIESKGSVAETPGAATAAGPATAGVLSPRQ